MLVLVKTARAARGKTESSRGSVLEPDLVLGLDGRVLVPSGEVKILRDGDSIPTGNLKDHVLVQMPHQMVERLVNAAGEPLASSEDSTNLAMRRPKTPPPEGDSGATETSLTIDH